MKSIVRAQKNLGAAKTSAFYAVAPFIRAEGSIPRRSASK